MKKILSVSMIMLLSIITYAQGNTIVSDILTNDWFTVPLLIFFLYSICLGYVRFIWKEGRGLEGSYRTWENIYSLGIGVVIYGIVVSFQTHSILPFLVVTLLPIIGRVLGDVLAFVILPYSQVPLAPKEYKRDFVDTIASFLQSVIATSSSWIRSVCQRHA